jgi:hypothetical protein
VCDVRLVEVKQHGCNTAGMWHGRFVCTSHIAHCTAAMLIRIMPRLAQSAAVCCSTIHSPLGTLNLLLLPLLLCFD